MNQNQSAACAGTASSAVVFKTVDSDISFAHHWDHFLARMGVKRGMHRVPPGLYALGHPDRSAPVFVTSNYTLTFDAVRSALRGIAGYILVLDTQGINVWCAAGKKTFGTEELIRRLNATGLADVVRHRRLILPQLGAAGVAAHEIRRRTGFRVEYGPVRASDLPEYLKTHSATADMRTVRFPLLDRGVLIPVELFRASVILPTAGLSLLLSVLGGWVFALAPPAAVLAGTVVFPLLLPWIPTPNFSTKGALVGIAAALPFAWWAMKQGLTWKSMETGLAFLCIMPPVTAFLALNFTGSTTYTAHTGVRREIFRYIPRMAWTLAGGLALAGVAAFGR